MCPDMPRGPRGRRSRTHTTIWSTTRAPDESGQTGYFTRAAGGTGYPRHRTRMTCTQDEYQGRDEGDHEWAHGRVRSAANRHPRTRGKRPVQPYAGTHVRPGIRQRA
ncbi:hypothetical protein Shyhy01_76040 [Streptomyces hygroscopicus subsp. hygroscopicus]|nr:hypothetical protein Shyhy01_76040 [Streptomyces hygroscopicus subsp. hygroscopicus]